MMGTLFLVGYGIVIGRRYSWWAGGVIIAYALIAAYGRMSR